MMRSKSVVYFAHDPAHRLLPSNSDDDDDEFTCDGCRVAGAGRRYRCTHPGCGFTVHEACARGSPRKLKAFVDPHHRLRRRESAAAGLGDGGAGCEVCGEAVAGACYCCPTCAVAVHPLCARLPGRAAHAGGKHEAWLVRAASAAPADNEKAVAVVCAACARPVGAWRYRCATCREELHPRCLVPATEQGRQTGESQGSVAGRCCAGLLHDVTRCLATMGTALEYRGYYNG